MFVGGIMLFNHFFSVILFAGPTYVSHMLHVYKAHHKARVDVGPTLGNQCQLLAYGIQNGLPTLAQYRKPWRDMGIFKKKPLVNRHIELCNPFSRISNSFPRISNSFPRIGQLVLSDCNSFPRIKQSVLSDCNSFPRIKQWGLQFVPSNWSIRFSDCN